MKRSTQASLTDMFNKMSKVSKPTRPESSEEKTWNRTTMTEDRLNGLALLHIHKNVNIDRERVLDAFDASGNRRIGSLHF